MGAIFDTFTLISFICCVCLSVTGIKDKSACLETKLYSAVTYEYICIFVYNVLSMHCA